MHCLQNPGIVPQLFWQLAPGRLVVNNKALFRPEWSSAHGAILVRIALNNPGSGLTPFLGAVKSILAETLGLFFHQIVLIKPGQFGSKSNFIFLHFRFDLSFQLKMKHPPPLETGSIRADLHVDCRLFEGLQHKQADA